MDLEVIRAKLIADASQFVAELEKASGALGDNGNGKNGGGLANSATKASHGMTMLRNGLSGLAMQATGTVGPIGRISTGLLTLGGGNMAVLGIAAAIGAVAVAIRMLTAEARADAEALEKMDKALAAIGKHGEITGIKAKISALESQLAKSDILTVLGRGIKGVFGAAPAEQNQEIKRQIADLKIELAKLEGEIKSPFQKALADSRESLRESAVAIEHVGDSLGVQTEAVRIARLEYEKFDPALARTIAANERLAATNNAITNATRETNAAFAEAFIRYNDFGKGADAVQEEVDRLKLSMQGLPDDVAERLAGVQRQTREMLRSVADMEQLRQLGVDAGKQLVMGLAEGMASMQDFLKFVFDALMDFTLGKIFGMILGGFGGTASPFGTGSINLGGPGGGPVRSVVAPTNPAVNFNLTGMPAATNPLAAARDGEWQRFLRESFAVAMSQGFRTA